MRRTPLPVLIAFVLLSGCHAQPSLLIYSKTAGYRHASIEPGIEAIRRLGAENGFLVDATEDSTRFTDEILAGYDAVLFLSTTLDVLGEPGQQALQRYIEAGGGYVGIHAASDTEYDWPWYGQMVGGYFESHPQIQEARLIVVDSTHASTAHLPHDWVRTDEWYEIDYVNRDVNRLLEIDETSYMRQRPPSAGDRRPMAWYHEFDGGRVFYTALGHTIESYSEPEFLQHILGGIEWAMGGRDALDYAAEGVRPRDDAFTRTVLADTLNEPMELDLLPDGRILFIERSGALFMHDPADGSTTLVDSLDVFYGLEDGLLGLAVDPDWDMTRFIYLYRSAASGPPRNVLSRFTFDGSTFDPASESVLLEVPTQRVQCCHAGGSVQFGPGRMLYVSTGDNTNPFGTPYSPTDERPGRKEWDAQRTAANTKDLRGKILRIHVTFDGRPEMPLDNLFSGDPDRGRLEIYVMGDRNPFRIHVDPQNGWLYWGEIGPDADAPDSLRGPMGYDEVNQARSAGNYGWPYFIADNLAYTDWDFARERRGPPRDPAAPVNDSPNNTGARVLPAARGAFMWYPYGHADDFPGFGVGGRSAMAGPVLRLASSSPAEGAFPAYYEGKLFVHEWMRDRVFAVTLDDGGDFAWMESFLPSVRFSHPIDLEFGPDGALYVLDYGQVWNQRNPDAALIRIAYHAS